MAAFNPPYEPGTALRLRPRALLRVGSLALVRKPPAAPPGVAVSPGLTVPGVTVPGVTVVGITPIEAVTRSIARI
jgi:hypothetical protein